MSTGHREEVKEKVYELKDDLTLGERAYRCECGNILDRDVNAEINIRMEAMRMKAS